MKQEVVLIVPTDPTSMVIIRRTVAGVASLAGLGLDSLEDLVLASSELCSLFCSKEPGNLELRFGLEDGYLSIKITGPRLSALTLEEELSLLIADSLAETTVRRYKGASRIQVRLKKT